MGQRFEYVGGSSAKFWEIKVDGAEVTVRYGRIGADGQQLTKPFADPAAARRHADGLIRAKVAKGYVAAA